MPERAYKVFSPGDIVEHVFFDSDYRVVKSGTYYTDVVTTDGTETDISFPTADLFLQAVRRNNV